MALDSLVVQITGPEDRVESLIELLRNFGIMEMVRTGQVVMVRADGSRAPSKHNGVC